MKRNALLSIPEGTDLADLIRLNPDWQNRKRFSHRGYLPNIDPWRRFYSKNKNGEILVPRNFPCSHPVDDNTQSGAPIDIHFKGVLRPYQQAFIDTLPQGDCIINMPCGTGKTIVACYLIATIRRQTLIIVPSQYLRDQWDDRIEDAMESLTGIKPFLVTAAKQKFETEPVVVMTYKMAAALPAARFQLFGVVVMDEIHHAASLTYEPIFHKLPAKIRIGLTATPRRTDDLWEIVEYHCGPVFQMPNPFPRAKLIHVWTDFWTTGGNWSQIESEVANDEGRNKTICGMIKTCIDAGRKVLILSKRVQPLKDMANMFPNAGLAIGELKTKPEQLKGKNPIFASMNIGKEGMDIEDMDTLIFHTPCKDMEQPVGRVLRVKEGKKQPLVILPQDQVRAWTKAYGGALCGYVEKDRTMYKPEDMHKII